MSERSFSKNSRTDISNAQGKGFTLIELLVVIAIVAVLSTVLVLTLNPAELLKQARDSNRISDMNTLKSSIVLFLADSSTTNIGAGNGCYESGTASTTCPFSGVASTSATSSRKVDGTGWVPVNLTVISAGSPISALPIDPINNTTYFYAYIASSTGPTFEIDAKMESLKYSTGTSNVVFTDGGNDNAYYEVGTNLTF